jgi:hypothetical protein
VQQPLGVDPAQRMGADAELSGIVGYDHRIADVIGPVWAASNCRTPSEMEI